jgi:MoaA/NifB/PqqE/SkfB family radical SAM enzyme
MLHRIVIEEEKIPLAALIFMSPIFIRGVEKLMKEEFNLERYLSDGVENIVKNAMRSSLSNPKESIFLAKYALAAKNARSLRHTAEEKGEHIPPFLIASIASTCNLHCTGCYARENHTCQEQKDDNQLREKDWVRIFKEAEELGISFILLAGGEPLMRRDIITGAGEINNIIFPVFTNGTLLTEDYIVLFDQKRNLIPILSIEGDEVTTDQRRGAGVYEKVTETMNRLKKRKILYGASITVTKENISEVTSQIFLEQLYDRGCKVVIYVEYVPVTEDTKKLAPEDQEREFLKEALEKLRIGIKDMLFISFPGDEKAYGGCLAAGRGFFHINPQGGAEPCPFSPFSDTNLCNVSLKEALNSPLFRKLGEQKLMTGEHAGGCVLFEQKELVRAILAGN